MVNDRIEAALVALPNITKKRWDLRKAALYTITTSKKGSWPSMPFRSSMDGPEAEANAIVAQAAPDLAAEVIRLREEVARLTEKLKSYQRAGESISQALNEGKGEYKP